jgi:RNA polymerase-binding transcription factor DksA
MMKDHTAILQRELDQVQHQIAALEKATEVKPDYGLGEGDPGITRWEMDKALLERLTERRDRLKHTLSGTGDEPYGICAGCGDPIHPDRLAVLPDTTTCIDCARMAQPRWG